MSQPGNHLVLQCISPIDGTVFIERELADSNAISQSIELSRLAQKQWQRTSLVERARICESAVAYFETKQAQIAEEIAWQMGRPVAFAGGEVNGLAERARHMIALAEQSMADVVGRRSWIETLNPQGAFRHCFHHRSLELSAADVCQLYSSCTNGRQ